MVEGNITLQSFCLHRVMGPIGLMIILLVYWLVIKVTKVLAVLTEGTTTFGRKLLHVVQSSWRRTEGGESRGEILNCLLSDHFNTLYPHWRMEERNATSDQDSQAEILICLVSPSQTGWLADWLCYF